MSVFYPGFRFSQVKIDCIKKDIKNSFSVPTVLSLFFINHQLHSFSGCNNITFILFYMVVLQLSKGRKDLGFRSKNRSFTWFVVVL